MRFHLLLCDASASTGGGDLVHEGLHPPRFIALGPHLFELRCVVERAKPEESNICAAAMEARYSQIAEHDFKSFDGGAPEKTLAQVPADSPAGKRETLEGGRELSDPTRCGRCGQPILAIREWPSGFRSKGEVYAAIGAATGLDETAVEERFSRVLTAAIRSDTGSVRSLADLALAVLRLAGRLP